MEFAACVLSHWAKDGVHMVRCYLKQGERNATKLDLDLGCSLILVGFNRGGFNTCPEIRYYCFGRVVYGGEMGRWGVADA